MPSNVAPPGRGMDKAPRAKPICACCPHVRGAFIPALPLHFRLHSYLRPYPLPTSPSPCFDPLTIHAYTIHMSYTCCFRCIALPITGLYTLVTLSVVLITMAVIHLQLDIHPSKRRRTLTGAVISTAVSAAVIGTGVCSATTFFSCCSHWLLLSR